MHADPSRLLHAPPLRRSPPWKRQRRAGRLSAAGWLALVCLLGMWAFSLSHLRVGDGHIERFPPTRGETSLERVTGAMDARAHVQDDARQRVFRAHPAFPLETESSSDACHVHVQVNRTFPADWTCTSSLSPVDPGRTTLLNLLPHTHASPFAD